MEIIETLKQEIKECEKYLKEGGFTFNEVIMNPNLTKDKLIYIDELTGCLQMFFRGKIEYATVTALCEFKPFTGEYLGEFRTWN